MPNKKITFDSDSDEDVMTTNSQTKNKGGGSISEKKIDTSDDESSDSDAAVNSDNKKVQFSRKSFLNRPSYNVIFSMKKSLQNRYIGYLTYFHLSFRRIGPLYWLTPRKNVSTFI